MTNVYPQNEDLVYTIWVCFTSVEKVLSDLPQVHNMREDIYNKRRDD
jgi:hypothetical protein